MAVELRVTQFVPSIQRCHRPMVRTALERVGRFRCGCRRSGLGQVGALAVVLGEVLGKDARLFLGQGQGDGQVIAGIEILTPHPVRGMPWTG